MPTMLLRLRVALRRGLRRELREDVRPHRLGAHALIRERLHPVAQLRAAVLVHRALDDALVVVDEQPRRDEVRLLLLEQLELERAADRIRGARAELPLIVDGRHLRAQIDGGWQRGRGAPRNAKREVALVGKIRNPSESLDRELARHRHLLLSECRGSLCCRGHRALRKLLEHAARDRAQPSGSSTTRSAGSTPAPRESSHASCRS